MSNTLALDVCAEPRFDVDSDMHFDKSNRFARAKTLWRILEIALEDLRSVARSKRYVVAMGMWHAPVRESHLPEVLRTGKSVCQVCLAGAVIAMEGHCDPTVFVLPEHFPSREKDKLLALDDMRYGIVRPWRGKRGVDVEAIFRKETGQEWWPGYDDRKLWWQAMRWLLAWLKKERR